MSGITSLPTQNAPYSRINGQSGINTPLSPNRALKSAATRSSADAEHAISSFSQALSGVAVRAAERDANSTRQELSRVAQATIDKVVSDSYQRNKAAYDVEVPNPDDPQRLAQARQATEYTNGKGNNPFSGMPQDQLALIAYDESGTFTSNERRAAWDESYSQRQAWGNAIVASIMDEYNRKGKVSGGVYQAVLDHYKSLPAIEEARLPEGYDTQLQTLIDHNSDDVSQGIGTLESIFDQLIKRLNDRPPQNAQS